MKRKTKLGTQFSTFLTLSKEVYPHFEDGGSRKERQGLFSCQSHPESYYLLTYRQARQYCSSFCPCISGYQKKRLQDYSYTADQNRHRRVLKKCHPSWFKVTKYRLEVNGEIFYEFEGKKDYVLAKKIETSIWNSKRILKKAFYLARFSYEMDKMHRDGEITFDSMLWNRGSGVEFFKQYLDVHNPSKVFQRRSSEAHEDK